MDDASTLDTPSLASPRGNLAATRPALVVVWCAAEPGRVGEVILLDDDEATYVFGRGDPPAGSRSTRAGLVRQRPGRRERVAPLDDPFLSREQLRMRVRRGGVEIENLGKRRLVGADGAHLAAGDAIEIKNRLVLLCVRRPALLPPMRDAPSRKLPAFGEPDEHGIVGESAAAWELREAIAFAGPRPAHVLLVGESGTGKELAAQAIHASSPRAGRRLVARSAATLPGTLIDAELFGNAPNYPNAGMPERPGLVGEADGSTLFFDEIGELSEELQGHLLRVLDSGEYHRLGDARRRAADLRLIGASNRGIERLKHDLAARFLLRIQMPALDARREDVPLIAHWLLVRIASRDASVGARFFEGWDGARGEPRLAPALVRALVTHAYTTHVRELERLLWRSLATSPGSLLDLTDEVRAEVATKPEPAPAPEVAVTADAIRAALAQEGGVRENVWRRLGLANRYVLRRLMKKYGIEER